MNTKKRGKGRGMDNRLINYINKARSYDTTDIKVTGKARRRLSSSLKSNNGMKQSIRLPPNKAILFNTLPKKRVKLAAAKERKEREMKIPKEFSWKGNKLIEKPRNQLLCGSCWAFAVASVFSDVVSIATKGAIKPTLSATSLLSCNAQWQCGGGFPMEAIKYIINDGITKTSCVD